MNVSAISTGEYTIKVTYEESSKEVEGKLKVVSADIGSLTGTGKIGGINDKTDSIVTSTSGTLRRTLDSVV